MLLTTLSRSFLNTESWGIHHLSRMPPNVQSEAPLAQLWAFPTDPVAGSQGGEISTSLFASPSWEAVESNTRQAQNPQPLTPPRTFLPAMLPSSVPIWVPSHPSWNDLSFLLKLYKQIGFVCLLQGFFYYFIVFLFIAASESTKKNQVLLSIFFNIITWKEGLKTQYFVLSNIYSLYILISFELLYLQDFSLLKSTETHFSWKTLKLLF